jgi:catechol 2,3-dioxygenase-like lactoylglutathione lyase family enzyme
MPPLKTANTILYCRHWEKTVPFYRDRLRLPVHFANDWFVEFSLTDTSRLSIADERRASVKSVGGRGITLAFEVQDIRTAHRWAESSGLAPTALRRHPWNAQVFYLRDPEGHRIEFWQATADPPASRKD